MAGQLVRQGVEINRDQTKIISILFPTGLDFLIIWVSLMRMGYGVVLVAPQCSPAAVLNLHKANHSQSTIYHPKYSRLAGETSRLDGNIKMVEMQLDLDDKPAVPLHDTPIDPNAISHVFHSSGTSGLPKPIPNTHAGTVTVLPRRDLPSYISPSNDQDGMPPSESAAFTTTPLFHGGVSDLLRAWMARSVLYLYPTSDVPVTTQNVIGAVHACRAPPDPVDDYDSAKPSMLEREHRYKPTAFLSVPYILSILAEDLDGVRLLQGMDIVSTGGAPLDTSIGNEMVNKGVKLVSRLGSSECGFLLSSHRDYDSDKEWELLRNDSPYAGALRFEETSETGPTGQKRFEMVVTSEWTSLTKSNRQDGSYATGDLYEQDASRSDAWHFVGRGDDVIVMSNGEKASPGNMETLLRSSPALGDALVVGSDRPQLGLLLFPNHAIEREHLLKMLEPLVQEANKSSPSFAQISMDMCVVVSSDRISELPKSSKGTVQRGVANEVYRNEIQQMYIGQETSIQSLPKRNLTEVQEWILEAVQMSTGTPAQSAPLDISTDLFSWGVDSVRAARIRARMQKSLNTGGLSLPQNIVFEQPSVKRLAEYVHNQQEGIANTGRSNKDVHELMKALTTRYGTFDPIEPPLRGMNASASDMLLTGGTGSLGAHIIHRLCSSALVGKIICLVRANGDASARARLLDTLSSKSLRVDEDRLVVMAADVSKEHLGLPAETHNHLVRTIGVVIHAAWPVHFASSLVSFEDQIRGTRNLINLVRQSSQSRFLFSSSIASVLGGKATSQTLLEIPSNDPSTASPIGYSQSKWVVEAMCASANATRDLAGRIHILRIGQLCGDTVTGYWNEKEGWPLLIRTGQTTGVLPDLGDEPSWLPVDLAAQTIVDIASQTRGNLVYHVVHPLRIKWKTVLEGLAAAGVRYEVTRPSQWLAKVEASIAREQEDPSSGMLAMWKSAYGSDSPSSPEPAIDSTNARNASSILAEVDPFTAEDVVKMVDSWRRTGFLRE